MVVPSCLLGLFGMSIATVRAWPTEMPVYGVSFCSYHRYHIFITRCYHLCKTNIAVGLNVVTEFIVGYVLGGRPLCMMLFKACIRICRS